MKGIFLSLGMSGEPSGAERSRAPLGTRGGSPETVVGRDGIVIIKTTTKIVFSPHRISFVLIGRTRHKCRRASAALGELSGELAKLQTVGQALQSLQGE